MKKNYVWHKQVVSSDLGIINCPVYEPIKDFRRDPTGAYVLIRCDIKNAIIEVAICDKKHTIIKVFRGRKAQDLYYTIFEYENFYFHILSSDLKRIKKVFIRNNTQGVKKWWKIFFLTLFFGS